MRELATQADYEDAEFEDRPTRALARREARALAREDRDDRADREPSVIRETSPWMPLAIGLGIIAVLGMAGVVVYLLVRRKDDGTQTVLGAVDPRYLPQPAPVAAPQVFVINTGNGSASTPAPITRTESEPVTGLGESPLPPFYPSDRPFHQRISSIDSNAPAERLVTAGAHALEVLVHVAEPRGASAVLAFTPNSLHTSHAIILPSGQERRIRVEPHQTLYAKGRSSAGQVILSVTAG
jgi:hypothetical protein